MTFEGKNKYQSINTYYTNQFYVFTDLIVRVLSTGGIPSSHCNLHTFKISSYKGIILETTSKLSTFNSTTVGQVQLILQTTRTLRTKNQYIVDSINLLQEIFFGVLFGFYRLNERYDSDWVYTQLKIIRSRINMILARYYFNKGVSFFTPCSFPRIMPIYWGFQIHLLQILNCALFGFY